MRKPPFEHCLDCPIIIKLMDACPLSPFWQIFQEEGFGGLADATLLYELFMVIISLVPWISGLILGILLLKRRDMRSLIRAGTHLCAHITCDVVKVVYFKEDRPDGSCSLKYGLPSCHSIFAGLYTSWVLIEILVIGMKLKTRHIIAVISMLIVPYSRIYLIYHTLKQCIYGWTIGFGFAVVGLTLHHQCKKRRKNKQVKAKQ
ncbi:unnamed protein product (macronuclear) [Paramecium tetraurelia]|uniref:Phosphatidic acid phosphatase type 2/haloperoxidase domain-containing protein n=1 Tax=Paramecium tetraurelia TaxID=5888 RepID=A0DPA1_PARTE|nr:uncharacterized protein GSPATT00019050001 [Paramecium tetraurelia]CAK84868.1 unnamed protein product [Paramecium tetraurelia]|eukprot:XP_001452265.1 hypothetical protein (macronuclear) [Paramecium tetraurelia strain d4-2]